MLTKANLSLITPQPFVSESNVREENGVLTAGSNSITLSDTTLSADEAMIVILGGLVQQDYTRSTIATGVNSTSTIISFNETADVDIPYKIILGVVLSRVADTYKDDPHVGIITNSNGNIRFTLNTNSGDVFYTEITQDSTIDINVGPGNRMSLLILKNAGAYTITWPANLRWPNGSAPSLTASGYDYIYLSKLNVSSESDGYLLCGMVTKNLAVVSS